MRPLDTHAHTCNRAKAWLRVSLQCRMRACVHAYASKRFQIMAKVTEKKYALSFEILGHSADVRAVCCVLLHGETREHIVTGSRDGTACVWRPDPSSNTEYLLHKVIQKHTGYVSALCVIPQDVSAGRHYRKRFSY